jgi:hypothetical protein
MPLVKDRTYEGGFGTAAIREEGKSVRYDPGSTFPEEIPEPGWRWMELRVNPLLQTREQIHAEVNDWLENEGGLNATGER